MLRQVVHQGDRDTAEQSAEETVHRSGDDILASGRRSERVGLALRLMSQVALLFQAARQSLHGGVGDAASGGKDELPTRASRNGMRTPSTDLVRGRK